MGSLRNRLPGSPVPPARPESGHSRTQRPPVPVVDAPTVRPPVGTAGHGGKQHACGSATAAWSFRLSTAACATATGTVNEAGQIWALNGATKPKQAPHPGVICRYVFHGTYNPAHDGNSIAYSDVITWAVHGGGVATLQYYGHFTLSGYPCSPTSC